ncbi:hypothetical protein CRG98_011211 [Punica granatum]|uniref:Uncharacterized protein n=1 Tax=Punica granatum TaxID=22663 RepID=A0A2I0KIS3_PUNGR|nr:hypothetical protein CRG98_011211 [Punica granatum]
MRKENRGRRREGSSVAFVPTTTMGPAPAGEQLIATSSLHQYLLIPISCTCWLSHEIRSIALTSSVLALSTWNPSSRPEHRRPGSYHLTVLSFPSSATRVLISTFAIVVKFRWRWLRLLHSSRSWPPLYPSRSAYSPLVDQRCTRAVLNFTNLGSEEKTVNEVDLGGRRGPRHPPLRSGKVCMAVVHPPRCGSSLSLSDSLWRQERVRSPTPTYPFTTGGVAYGDRL